MWKEATASASHAKLKKHVYLLILYFVCRPTAGCSSCISVVLTPHGLFGIYATGTLHLGVHYVRLSR